jgi:chromosome partitioning protein
MKTLAVEIQKGGEGKTFLACNLAFDAYEHGIRTVVIDADAQGNASLTLGGYKCGLTASTLFLDDKKALRDCIAQHKHNGLVLIGSDNDLIKIEKLKFSDAAKKLSASLKVLDEYFDLCIIDTPPALGVSMTAAALAADYVISPVRLEPYSMQGMKKMVAVIGNLRMMKPDLKWMGMVPNMVRLGTPRHSANLQELKEAFPSYVLPISIGLRDSIAEGLGSQVPVWEVLNDSGQKKSAARQASKEVRALAKHVFSVMGLKQ